MNKNQKKAPKLHVRKGDRVRVIAGGAKGMEGAILRVFPQTQRVIVEGVNIRTKNTKANPQAGVEGGQTHREMPIHASNVQPIDRAGNPTRVGRRWDENAGKGGQWVRYAKSTGDAL